MHAEQRYRAACWSPAPMSSHERDEALRSVGQGRVAFVRRTCGQLAHSKHGTVIAAGRQKPWSIGTRRCSLTSSAAGSTLASSALGYSPSVSASSPIIDMSMAEESSETERALERTTLRRWEGDAEGDGRRALDPGRRTRRLAPWRSVLKVRMSRQATRWTSSVEKTDGA